MSSIKAKDLPQGTQCVFQVSGKGFVLVPLAPPSVGGLQLITVTEPSVVIPDLTGPLSQVNLIYPAGLDVDCEAVVTLDNTVSQATIVVVNLSNTPQSFTIRSQTYISGAALVNGYWVWSSQANNAYNQANSAVPYQVFMSPTVGVVESGYSVSTLRPPSAPISWAVEGLTPDGTGVYTMTVAQFSAIRLLIQVAPADYATDNLYITIPVGNILKNGVDISADITFPRLNRYDPTPVPPNQVDTATQFGRGDLTATAGDYFVFNSQLTIGNNASTGPSIPFVFKVNVVA